MSMDLLSKAKEREGTLKEQGRRILAELLEASGAAALEELQPRQALAIAWLAGWPRDTVQAILGALRIGTYMRLGQVEPVWRALTSAQRRACWTLVNAPKWGVNLRVMTTSMDRLKLTKPGGNHYQRRASELTRLIVAVKEHPDRAAMRRKRARGQPSKK